MVENLVRSLQDTQDQIGNRDVSTPVFKLFEDNYPFIHAVEKTVTQNIGNAFVLGHSSNGELGASSAGVNGSTVTLGSGGFGSSTLSRVANLNNLFVEPLRDETYVASATSATVDTTSYKVDFATSQLVFESESVSLNDGTITEATLNFDENNMTFLPSAWYGFSGNADDKSGNGNDGTANGISYEFTKFGLSPLFVQADNDYVSIPNGDTLITDDSNWGITFWFKATSINASSTENRIVRFVHSGSDSTFVIGLENSTELDFSSRTTTPAFTTYHTETVSANTWYHVVVTYDGTSFRSYVNGELVDTATRSFAGFQANTTYLGSGDTTNNPYSGYIKDFRVYDGYVLDATEVSDIYNGGFGRENHFKMNETITYEMTADGGSNWESVTPNTPHLFTNTGQDLRYRVTGVDGATLVVRQPEGEDIPIKASYIN